VPGARGRAAFYREITMRILLVEDDNRFADALGTALRRQGHEVDRARDAREALAAPTADIVLLDLGLPDADGLEVCRELRSRSQVAIIAVTARGEERDRVRGLRSGADDYLVKPFGIAELEARIDAVMRRARPSGDTPGRPVRLGAVSVDLARRTVSRDGQPLPLTRKEFDLLALLVRSGGAVVSRDRILAEVWRTTWRGVGRTLEVHVASLRGKLGDPALIETVRCVGYRLHVTEAAGLVGSNGEVQDPPVSPHAESPHLGHA
jgi:DNA-binding response OmpR family regulator